MIMNNEAITHPSVNPQELTDRQRQALTLIQDYYRTAHEAPSYGWLARRLGVSRERAVQYIGVLRRKGWLGTQRSR